MNGDAPSAPWHGRRPRRGPWPVVERDGSAPQNAQRDSGGLWWTQDTAGLVRQPLPGQKLWTHTGTGRRLHKSLWHSVRGLVALAADESRRVAPHAWLGTGSTLAGGHAQSCRRTHEKSAYHVLLCHHSRSFWCCERGWPGCRAELSARWMKHAASTGEQAHSQEATHAVDIGRSLSAPPGVHADTHWRVGARSQPGIPASS